MHFTKWQACGNDFVFINAAENPDIKSISDQAKLLMVLFLFYLQKPLS